MAITAAQDFSSAAGQNPAYTPSGAIAKWERLKNFVLTAAIPATAILILVSGTTVATT